MPAPGTVTNIDTRKVAPSNVANVHPQYTAMADSWQMMYDVCVSEKHIQSRGTYYLPRLDGMTDDQYLAYTKRAEFPLFTRHALDSFVGMAMRKELLIEGLPVDHEFFKNCDGKGTSLKSYCERLVRKFLQYRRCGTLVEMPASDPNKSKAAAEAENIRPRFAFYDHTSIINWKTTTENNIDKLSLVVLKESVDASEDEFTHDTQNRYRVLKLVNGVYVQDIYDHNKSFLQRITPTMGGVSLTEIPFTIHGGIEVFSPIMLPIAEQNIHWYIKDADYQHGLHYTALPTPWVVGVDPQDENAPKTIGPQRLWMLPIGATCGMLEFTGKGLGEIKNSMADTMQNITVLSSQILVPKSSNDETATAASIRSASETASLSAMVSDLSSEISELVSFAAEWGAFEATEIDVEINSDFIPLTLSGADVSAYVSAVLKEGFSKRTLFELLKKGEIIEGSRQFEEELADITREAQERMDKEVELAERIAEVESKVAKLYTQNPDSKEQTGQDIADPPRKNSAIQNESE